jgi:hypothetical protein
MLCPGRREMFAEVFESEKISTRKIFSAEFFPQFVTLVVEESEVGKVLGQKQK